MKSSRPVQLIVIGIVVLAAVFILLVKDQQGKDQPQATTPAAGSSSALPEAQLNRAVQAGKPVLAFFHSNSCEQCRIMIDTMEQVYPEFSQSVVLVDVNVYDPSNEALMRSAKVQFIPTLVFYDANGQTEMHVGVMEADALRTRLAGLGGVQ